jgi:hypothetical protein
VIVNDVHDDDEKNVFLCMFVVEFILFLVVVKSRRVKIENFYSRHSFFSHVDSRGHGAVNEDLDHEIDHRVHVFAGL